MFHLKFRKNAEIKVFEISLHFTYNKRQMSDIFESLNKYVKLCFSGSSFINKWVLMIKVSGYWCVLRLEKGCHFESYKLLSFHFVRFIILFLQRFEHSIFKQITRRFVLSPLENVEAGAKVGQKRRRSRKLKPKVDDQLVISTDKYRDQIRLTDDIMLPIDYVSDVHILHIYTS